MTTLFNKFGEEIMMNQNIDLEKETFLSILSNLPNREKKLLEILSVNYGGVEQKEILKRLGDLSGKGTAGSLRNIKKSINNIFPDKILPDGKKVGRKNNHRIDPKYYEWVKEWFGNTGE